MRDEIAQKWPKFTTAEIGALKSKEDLVSGVQSKYALDKAQAQKDVDAFATGANSKSRTRSTSHGFLSA